MSEWVECPKCKGTGINPDALLIEPFHRLKCPLCCGTGWIIEEEEGGGEK